MVMWVSRTRLRMRRSVGSHRLWRSLRSIRSSVSRSSLVRASVWVPVKIAERARRAVVRRCLEHPVVQRSSSARPRASPATRVVIRIRRSMSTVLSLVSDNKETRRTAPAEAIRLSIASDSGSRIWRPTTDSDTGVGAALEELRDVCGSAWLRASAPRAGFNRCNRCEVPDGAQRDDRAGAKGVDNVRWSTPAPLRPTCPRRCPRFACGLLHGRTGG